MRRRQFLAAGAALCSLTVAGCAHPEVVLDMDEASSADIADEVSTSPDPGSEEHTVVTAAIENGSATRSGRYELFDRTDTVRIDDAVYTVTETRLRSGEVTVYEVLVDVDPDDTTPDRGEVRYDDLPAVDRERLDIVFSEDPPSSGGEYDVGVTYGTAEEVGNESVFVPDQQYDIVVHDGERYRIGVDSREANEAEYRYEVTQVAPDLETFADQMRDRYRFELTGLSDAERSVVEEAIDGGHFEDSDAFRSVVDRIRDHEGLHEADFHGTWLVAYDGGEYLTYAEW
ncbi:hypothetical protein [Halostella salina]|uniref:hypothetical protein n=1 Tax=Halostella salina TaxID=1547897 RepID=UPI000EF80F2C|nr:hypothetical protein [Halostella salina]